MANRQFISARKFAVFVAAMLALSVVQPSHAQAPQPGGVPISTPQPTPDLPLMAAPGAMAEMDHGAATPEPTAQDVIVAVSKGISMTNGLALGRKNDLAHFMPIDSAVTPEHGFQLTASRGNGVMSLSPVMTATAPTLNANGSHIINVRIVIYNPSYNSFYWQTSRISQQKAWLEAGARWKGYGHQSVVYNIVAQTNMGNMTSPKLANGNGNVAAMMVHAQNSCAAIAASNIPTQVWVFGDTRSHLGEFMIQGPKFNNAFGLSHNMPNCGHQYTVFGYAYAGEYVEGDNNWHSIVNSNALHDHGHYFEWMFMNAAAMGYHKIGCNAVASTGGINGGNPVTQYYYPSSGYNTPFPNTYTQDLYECADPVQPQSLNYRVNFMTRATAENGAWVWAGCSSVHYPANAMAFNDLPAGAPYYGAYIYDSMAGAANMCNTWWVQSPTYEWVTCAFWSCTPEGWYVFWMQRIPTWDSPAVDRAGNSYAPVVSPIHNGWRGIMWILN